MAGEFTVDENALDVRSVELLRTLMQGRLADMAVHLDAKFEELGKTTDDIGQLSGKLDGLEKSGADFEEQVEFLKGELGGDARAAVTYWAVEGMRESIKALMVYRLNTAWQAQNPDGSVPSFTIISGAKEIQNGLKDMLIDFGGLGEKQSDELLRRLNTEMDRYAINEVGKGR